VGWRGTSEVTAGIFITGIDHRGVLKRGFHKLCYLPWGVSAPTGAAVDTMDIKRDIHGFNHLCSSRKTGGKGETEKLRLSSFCIYR